MAQWVREHGVDAAIKSHGAVHSLCGVAKLPGVYVTCLPFALLVCVLHRLRWCAGGFLCLAGIAGGFNTILKWVFGRTRPYKLGLPGEPLPFLLKPFRGGLAGLFHQENLAFPSGHAATAFATATALAILLPRWRLAFYAMAGVVAVERVLENAHYLSDTVAAAAMSVIVVQLLWRICVDIQLSLGADGLAPQPTGKEAI